MKGALYFSHDFGARYDPKLQRVLMDIGVSGWGIYWSIIEQLNEQGGYLALKQIPVIAFELRVESKLVEHLVKDFDLFKYDKSKFWSESSLRRIKARLDITQKRKLAAQARWEKKNNDDANASKDNANALQSDAIKNKSKSKTKGKEESPKTNRFCPPSIEEVQKYIEEKNYTQFVNAQKFIAFYESKGWMIGKNKMKNWKQAIATWYMRGKDDKKANKQQITIKNANEEWQ